MRRILLFFLAFALFGGAARAQQQVAGKVTDSRGEPLPGVNIIVKNTSTGTVTNVDGTYSLKVSEANSILLFSYIGYTPAEVPVNGRSNIDVTMKEDQQHLDEVVVVGYGTVKKSDLTGSVASITSAELKAVPVATFDQALQGRAAGVQVVQSNGVPGGGTNIRIRGTTSVSASSEPLYVIDGMLINNNPGEMSAGGRGPSINPLSTINPGDIESIEVLKDASATAIYGSRAANGVILITTRKGKAGKASINFETYYGSQQVTKTLDMLNATQFAELVNEAQTNAKLAPVYTNPASFGEGTNWQKELFRKASIANYQVSLAGGNEKTRYAMGGGYFKQNGIVQGSDFDRYSFKLNLDTDISKRLKVGTNLAYNRMSTNGVLTGPGNVVQGVVTNALMFNPILPVYDPSRPGGYTFQHDRRDAVANPIAEAKEYEAITTTSRVLGSVFAEYQIIEGLTFRSSFGIDALNTKSNTFGPNFLKRTENSKGEASVTTLQALTWLNTNTFNYTKQINKDNSFNVLLGLETQKFRNESVNAYAFGFPDSRTGWHDIGSAENPQTTSNGELQWSMLSYFGRVNYSFKNKYLFTVTGRSDGSSKFSEGRKFGFFPSAAFAWKVSEENFMKSVNFIQDLKFRASYGRTGNQSIQPYRSLALIGALGQGVFSTTGQEVIRGREPVSYPNKSLKWETTDQVNAAIDLSVLKGRLDITVEAYNKNTIDLLLDTPIPYTTGFENTLLNIGNVRNRGIDVAINSVNLDGKVQWNTSLNVSVNRNKITNLARNGDVNLGVGGNILREGEPIGTFFGYVFDGIYQTDEEAKQSPAIAGQSPAAGDRKYKDISGPNGTPDGIINDFDRTIIGSAQPDFTWGLNNSVTFKNVTLSLFFQGSQGNQMVNQNLGDLANVNGKQNVLAEAGLGRWTPQNHSNRYARALATANDNVFSSRFIEDASYLRLKNITLGYNFAAPVLKKLGLASARLYVSATNLWTVTNYSGYDPEGNAYGNTTNIVGVDFGSYPQAKTYTVGLNFGF
ncbi:TonB-linked outer membrane protein, SusC/RagA family [Dyadobacter sp. SG02]|uniref:SusC/RagA family TonB-linked outer membrane protein n=1 Tax=Dyadobacter sp. SG02 TaxID=1855291 RepID=UPI0008BB31DB|nr:TonB-dependent receptor [Dyadobacter sp. SG02]SEJ40413.1 TonB-linked outer membrane protein, SusC/RagA family [Dyadobacter sp. SG02]